MVTMLHWRNERVLLASAVLCLTLSMMCEHSMTNSVWKRRFLVQHVIQSHNEAAQHARLAALDEILAWHDEDEEEKLATQAKELWNKTDMEQEEMMEKEQQAHAYYHLAKREESASIAQQNEADEDQYKAEYYFQQAQVEADMAMHFKEDYCVEYYIPSYWCNFVGRFAGWENIQAQQAMQANNDFRLALVEEQAAEHAAKMAKLYHFNATRHAHLFNRTNVQAQIWHESYQEDKAHAQQLDAKVKTFQSKSQAELGNATQYGIVAQHEWQEAITLAHQADFVQHQAAFYASTAILAACLLMLLALQHLLKKGRDSVQVLSEYIQQQPFPHVVHRFMYVKAHMCIFLVVLGGMMKDEQVSQLLLMRNEHAGVVSRDNLGGIIFFFAIQAALLQLTLLHLLPLCFSQHDDDLINTNQWQSCLIVAIGAFLKYYVIPALLFGMELLIVTNVRCVSLFAVGGILWWLVLVMLLALSTVHLLGTLPKPSQGSMDVLTSLSSKTSSASEKSPLMTGHATSGIVDDEKDYQYSSSNPSKSLVDVELDSSATTQNIPPPASRGACWSGCTWSSQLTEILKEQGTSIMEQASMMLELPLTILIWVRMGNLIFFNCLPTLHLLRPNSPTWLVPAFMTITSIWMVVRAVVWRRNDDHVGMKVITV